MLKLLIFSKINHLGAIICSSAMLGAAESSTLASLRDSQLLARCDKWEWRLNARVLLSQSSHGVSKSVILTSQARLVMPSLPESAR